MTPLRPLLFASAWALLPLLAPAQTLAPPAAPADAARAARIAAVFPVLDKLYADFAAQRHVPGLAYGLVVDGQLVHTGAVGYTDVATKTAVTPQSVFRIASMTKSFVALAVLRLRDEGRLRLDDPAENYLPELKKAPHAPTDAPSITIRQLLSHSAGLPEDNPWGDRQMGRSDAELSALVGGGLSFSNAPGVGYEYSNLGFALLGRIVTRVSGQPVQAYISEKILRPLGMGHTTWDYQQVPPARLAHGYGAPTAAGPGPEEPLLPRGESFAALGGLLTSVEDFAKYLAFQADAAPRPITAATPDAGPVRRSSVREMQQPWSATTLAVNRRTLSGRACPITSAYGYGLRIAQDCDGRRYVGHSGGLPGFGSYWLLLPEYGIGVVAFVNQTYAAPTAQNYAALDTLITLAGLRPRAVAASAILAQRKAELAAMLPDFNTPATNPLFAENFFLDEDLATRRKAAQALLAQAGPIRSVGELEPENQLRGRFRLLGERATVEVFFTLSPESPARVQHLDLQLLPTP
ncbi:serine hydrolase domain-containing protein [Hymenobacter caeli]|uniref:CubicO group peptidase (Beta-lactamase class C family) n=1 Tax=Hymenobacter caeli TaxID=2735894 RepID=A0ABX2FS60_9BACT|nr:serine hydrolase domain-containing protein [Hymenobacter caeli]NRT20022.1 CubicO group peptidase (beta-lactamase class C family) [Hymenobacter caeli]